MPLSQENTRPIFRKLIRQASKLASKPSPENIHRFRTSTRRVEVLVTDLALEQGRNDKKLLKLLDRLRKKAGRVRDLDVEIAALAQPEDSPGAGAKIAIDENSCRGTRKTGKEADQSAGQENSQRDPQALEAKRRQPGDFERTSIRWLSHGRRSTNWKWIKAR